jgi:predicted transcriptional regulator
MAIIKAPPKQPKSVTVQARVEESVKEQLDLYAKFIDSTSSYVITQALKVLFKRDDERRRTQRDRVAQMKDAPTQPDMRENTASSRRHASRRSVNSSPSISQTIPKGLQHRPPRSLSASPTTETDNVIITTPLQAATGGETGDSAETYSVPATTITAEESRHVPVTPEQFVSADDAAQFLCVKRRYLLELARRGIAGAYALGTGSKRKIWVFRLSELANSVVRNETSIPKPQKPCTIGSGSPR